MESMKLLVPLLALGFGGAFAVPPCPRPICAATPSNNIVEEIVAKCNGDIVTRGDLDRARRELMETLRTRAWWAMNWKSKAR